MVCSWWSVESGDDGELLMAARKTVQTVAVCVRDQTEQIEKIGLPYTFYFYFCIFHFVIFLLFFCHVLC